MGRKIGETLWVSFSRKWNSIDVPLTRYTLFASSPLNMTFSHIIFKKISLITHFLSFPFNFRSIHKLFIIRPTYHKSDIQLFVKTQVIMWVIFDRFWTLWIVIKISINLKPGPMKLSDKFLKNLEKYLEYKRKILSNPCNPPKILIFWSCQASFLTRRLLSKRILLHLLSMSIKSRLQMHAYHRMGHLCHVSMWLLNGVFYD